MLAQPFFSICVEVRNRAETINKVLEHISNQFCKDFELIIFNNASEDCSGELIEDFISSNPEIVTKYFVSHSQVQEITAWNAPIKQASGKYIAICEGDDYFSPDHLSRAKELLTTTSDVALYVAGSKLKGFNFPILKNSDEIFCELLTFKWCPPPSTFIFQRESSTSKRYLFDEDFVWAAEYSLLAEVLQENRFVLINNEKNYVERGFRFYLKNSFHIQDMLLMREKFDQSYSFEEKQLADTAIATRAWQLFWIGLLNLTIDKELIRIFFRNLTPSRVPQMNLHKIFLRVLRQEIARRIKN